MDAIKFVKQNGIEKVKQIVELFPLSTLINIDGVSIPDLKQIVDTFELVESFGGLFQEKVALYKEGFTGGIECGDRLIEDDVLKQSIDLVEKCNER